MADAGCAFPPDRFVWIMGDVCSHGVWGDDGILAGPERLPIPRALRLRLIRWQARYDALDGARFEAWHSDGAAPDDAAWRIFDAEGEAIARAASEAMPGWRVIVWREVPPAGEPREVAFECAEDAPVRSA